MPIDDILLIADRMIAAVENAWPDNGGIHVQDRNQDFLVLGAAHAFRRFVAVRDRAAVGDAESANILARSLISITHRSLYLNATVDPEERYERLQRWLLDGYTKERTRVRRLVDAGVEELRDLLEKLEAGVERMHRWFDLAGKERTPPIFPTDETVAQRVELTLHYEEAYRSGSGDSHYSIFSAIGGYDDLAAERPGVGLWDANFEEARTALIRAIVVFGDFLGRAEPILQLGLDELLRELRDDLDRATD